VLGAGCWVLGAVRGAGCEVRSFVLRTSHLGVEQASEPSFSSVFTSSRVPSA